MTETVFFFLSHAQGLVEINWDSIESCLFIHSKVSRRSDCTRCSAIYTVLSNSKRSVRSKFHSQIPFYRYVLTFSRHLTSWCVITTQSSNSSYSITGHYCFSIIIVRCSFRYGFRSILQNPRNVTIKIIPSSRVSEQYSSDWIVRVF